MTTQDHKAAIQALDKLLQAAEEVHRHGAKTGPQWTRLAAAIVKARSDLSAALSTPPAPADPQGYIHPDNLHRLERGETVAFRKQPYSGERQIPVYLSAPPPQQPAPTCDVGHVHFTPFYLLANCRRIAAAKYRSKPNWVIAMELFALGSNSARKICQDAGIDPDALEVRPAAIPAAQADEVQGGGKC